MIHELTKGEIMKLIEPAPPVKRRCRISGHELLTEDQHACLGHWAMFGSEGYPVQKINGSWQVLGYRGCGQVPTTFKTKRAAFDAWQAYIAMLLDYEAGRITNPELFGL